MPRKVITPTTAAPTPTTYPIILAGRMFAVPRLPLRLNREAYPLCRKLVDSAAIARVVDDGTIEFGPEEFEDLATVAFIGASAADPEFTRDQFDDLPVTPIELLDAYFAVRVATGGWVLTAATPA